MLEALDPATEWEARKELLRARPRRQPALGDEVKLAPDTVAAAE
jgi:hypothetical protein